MRPVFEFKPYMRSVNLEEASIYKQIPANKGRQKRAGVPVVEIHTKSGVIRKVARTKTARNEMKRVYRVLRELNGLKSQTVLSQPAKPIEWKIGRAHV